MPWYRQGTVAITAGQTAVTGTGTNFSANSRVGDAFHGPDGRWYEVTNIASATVLSILPAYQGATVTGGSYGLAPMQGYVKESADRLRQIVDQWGATLAGLGSVSTENVVPVSKGGTGGTTQAAARTGLGLGSAAVAAIVGTVSQTAGVPTGAIIERGSNANGEYVKYADGTMKCWLYAVVTDQAIDTAYGSLFIGSRSWTFPAAFSAVPAVSLESRCGTGASWSGLSGGVSATTAQARLIDAFSRALGVTTVLSFTATGRWFN